MELNQIKMTKAHTPQSNDILFYSSPDGDVRVEVFFQEETKKLSDKKKKSQHHQQTK